MRAPTPQNAAGLPADPTFGTRRRERNIRADTAAADPLLEPPGVCPRFMGFLVGPESRLANIVVTVFPRTMAPASFRRATACASCSGTKSRNSGDPIVVRRPLV